MQDGAYYVGRHELLQWINQALVLNITKIEQTATGAVACQLLDSLHPGIVPMGKVDFNCKNEYEYITNWKVLQSAFNKLNINKEVNINNLVKARPLDNMEFMQWFKHYYDNQIAISGVPDYDPVLRREQSKSGNVREGLSSRGATSNVGRKPLKKSVSTNQPPPTQKRPPSAGKVAPGMDIDTGETRKLNEKLGELSREVDELKKQKQDAEDETNFYYEKLRAIETVCQELSQDNIPVINLITALLYAKEVQDHSDILNQWHASRDSENKPPNVDDNLMSTEFNQDLQL
eukprot:TRINITY_DN27319_c0_g1_i3.p2 TRINITY_DN27319_c0_g1~~TRINITY_DN27319_c0_g1_i3.p2  ORF type:complete len:309 (+),score=45.04 TRINITY_DN27319_c0_g1_i3:61-927(+)